MALAVTGATSVSNVIQPDIFTQYVVDKTTEKNAIMYAGAIENNAMLNQLITGGGTRLTMPKWQDLDGDDQVLSEDELIQVSGIQAKKEVATLLIRAHAWAATELSGALAGDDPMRRIGDLVSDWWVRQEKKVILAILEGIFKATGMDKHIYDVSSAALDAKGVLNAKQLMGDAADTLTMIYMHSAVFTDLQKQNLIAFIPDSEGKISIPTYLGYRVISDDSCPTTGAGTTADPTLYSAYLLSKGCIQRGIGNPVSITPTETDRHSLGSTDILINRQAKVFHPKGLSFEGLGGIGATTPNNYELADKKTDGSADNTSHNWKLVTDIKKVGIVKIKGIKPAA